MKNTIITILAIVVGISVGGYLIEAVQTKQAVDNLSNPTTEPTITTSEARKEFMIGCDTGEYYLQGAYCGCLFEQFLSGRSVNELVNDGLMLTEDQVAAKYDSEINYCLGVTYESQSI
jgi:hypothetical protein